MKNLEQITEESATGNADTNDKRYATKHEKSIPTCGVCEKVLLEKMREKHYWFNAAYAAGHALIRLWMRVKLSKEERNGEENNEVRACRTCEKVYLRRLKATSQRFNNIYKFLDGALDGMLEKALDENEKEEALNNDPVHAKELIKFNPKSYYKGDDFVLGIEFDGCIAKESYSNKSSLEIVTEPVSGIKDMLYDLKSRGVKIVVYGWRSAENKKGNPVYRKKAEEWLKANSIPYDFFHDGKSSLTADAFVNYGAIGEDVGYAYKKITSMTDDKDKNYLKRRR